MTDSNEFQTTRRLHGQSGSVLVALPKKWLFSTGLAEGDEVLVVFSRNGPVKITPAKPAGQQAQ